MSTENAFDYSGYDLIDEQLISFETCVRQENINYTENANANYDSATRFIRNDFIVCVGNSRWSVFFIIILSSLCL